MRALWTSAAEDLMTWAQVSVLSVPVYRCTSTQKKTWTLKMSTVKRLRIKMCWLISEVKHFIIRPSVECLCLIFLYIFYVICLCLFYLFSLLISSRWSQSVVVALLLISALTAPSGKALIIFQASNRVMSCRETPWTCSSSSPHCRPHCSAAPPMNTRKISALILKHTNAV